MAEHDEKPRACMGRTNGSAKVLAADRQRRSAAELRVGIVSIQGAVEPHAAAITRAGASWAPVRHAEDLDSLDALILPGGESTTIAKGLERVGLYEALDAFAKSGRPVLGTCAGAILMAREVEGIPVRCLGLIDAIAVRNAYGTQVDSFATVAQGELEGLRAIFIRAPRLKQPGPDLEVLARVDGWPVFVRQRNALATTFHPELTLDGRVHAALLELALKPQG
jgi:5'-phosphate synthase pdxT subunit